MFTVDECWSVPDVALIVTGYVPAGVPPVFRGLLFPPPQAAWRKSGPISRDPNTRKPSLRLLDLSPAEPIPTRARPGSGIHKAYIGVCGVPGSGVRAPDGPCVVTVSVELPPGMTDAG